jgi:Cu/Ag efflux protein CusF
MVRVMSLLIGVLFVAWAGMAIAQQPAPKPPAAQQPPALQQSPAPPSNPAASPASPSMQQVQGKVKRVDQAANRVTLDDGTQLTIPASVRVDWKTLKPGSGIRAQYQDRDGMKVVTRMDVGG